MKRTPAPIVGKVYIPMGHPNGYIYPRLVINMDPPTVSSKLRRVVFIELDDIGPRTTRLAYWRQWIRRHHAIEIDDNRPLGPLLESFEKTSGFADHYKPYSRDTILKAMKILAAEPPEKSIEKWGIKYAYAVLWLTVNAPEVLKELHTPPSR